jgi:hypothetical protein
MEQTNLIPKDVLNKLGQAFISRPFDEPFIGCSWNGNEGKLTVITMEGGKRQRWTVSIEEEKPKRTFWTIFVRRLKGKW